MPESSDRVAAESWFLQRGLPSVLTRRARWRRLWRRSAPMLVTTAVVACCVTAVALLDGENGNIVITEELSPADWWLVVLLALTIPLAAGAGWLTSRIQEPGGRRMASSLAVLATLIVLAGHGSFAGRIGGLLLTVGLVALVLGLNGIGVGSVLGWALNLTVTHLASAGALVTRALPVVLLSVLVFFNTYVWTMATKISRERMWLVLTFMIFIAGVFLLSGTVQRVRPILKSMSVREDDTNRLAPTPFAAMPDPSAAAPLSRREKRNVLFVVIASQVAQIAMVALVTGGIFFALGLVVLSPELLAAWTANGPAEGMMFGVTLPVPQPLIHVAMFLGALTFMYVSARAVGDGEYRKDFLDPLVDDLRLTLVARNRYRAHVEQR